MPLSMPSSLPDLASLTIVLFGAAIAGFTTGFAGFGTGLVASGLWFHALPAPMVPPLVALASVVGQIAGLFKTGNPVAWSRAAPYLIGGVAGVPLGVLALGAASPFLLRTSVGLFLVAYALNGLIGWGRRTIGTWGGRGADGLVGAGGGFLGGFAGLSAPLPVIWLQLRGGPPDQQRAVYQPFNLIVLAMASLGMLVSGQIDRPTLVVAALCLPVTAIGAWIGAHVYTGVSERTFRMVVYGLLLASGLILIAQAVSG
jgi:uncharacterized membrane protein YfcA